MANTKLVLEHEAQDKTKQIYEDIKKLLGYYPISLRLWVAILIFWK